MRRDIIPKVKKNDSEISLGQKFNQTWLNKTVSIGNR